MTTAILAEVLADATFQQTHVNLGRGNRWHQFLLESVFDFVILPVDSVDLVHLLLDSFKPSIFSIDFTHVETSSGLDIPLIAILHLLPKGLQCMEFKR